MIEIMQALWAAPFTRAVIIGAAVFLLVILPWMERRS